LGSRHGKKVTQGHHFMSYFLRSRAVRSLPCSVKAHVGMEPRAWGQCYSGSWITSLSFG